MRKNSVRSGAYSGAAQQEAGFWPSYADMMSAVALILFFLMLMSYIQNLITGNDLQNTQEALAFTTQQVEDARLELQQISLDLDGARLQLTDQQLLLDEQQKAIDAQIAEIEAQKLVIDSQRAEAEALQRYLTTTQTELTELRGQMQDIALLRLTILEQIRDSIAKIMGGSGKVSIGENGSIILSEGVLFDFGSAEVKSESTRVLNQLAAMFTEFLADDENAKYVDSIVISGHTDNRGSDRNNRELSTDRANAVLNYMLETDNGALNAYARYFCAAGYGATRPVASNSTDTGRSANRRIEISIILKDETVLNIVDQYLAIDGPNI